MNIGKVKDAPSGLSEETAGRDANRTHPTNESQPAAAAARETPDAAERLAFLASFYRGIFTRHKEMVFALRGQNASLIQMNLTIISLVMAALLALFQLGLRPTLLTMAVSAVAIVLHATSLVGSLAVFDPKKYADHNFQDDDFEVLRRKPLATLLSHEVYWTRDHLQFNYSVYNKDVTRHVRSFWLFKIGGLLLGFYGMYLLVRLILGE